MMLALHLLESTLFALAAAALAHGLRRHRAGARHAIWLAASVKFLIPAYLLASLGAGYARRSALLPVPRMRVTIAASAIPHTLPSSTAAPVIHSSLPRPWLADLLWLLWTCGCAAMLVRWIQRWCLVRRRLHDAAPLKPTPAGIPPGLAIVVSASCTEPALHGIFHPRLVIPAALEAHLSPTQWRAILQHELCHLHRRDNLAAALHMAVEAVFWFYPPVWWIGARMIEERERACDEAVLAQGADPATYAGAILQVCRLGLAPSPLGVGIGGADLRRRIAGIVSRNERRPLLPAARFALVLAAAAAVAVPLAAGIARPNRVSTQTPAPAPLAFDVASVKPSTQGFLAIAPQRSGGRITWTTDLTDFLAYAFHVPSWRISGPRPGSDRTYTVEATTSPNATDDQVRLMFQTLLQQRFQLAFHRSQTTVNGFAVIIAKKGLRLTEVKPGEPPPPLPDWFIQNHVPAADLEGKVVSLMEAQGVGAIVGRSATMAQFDDTLERLLQTAVVDETALPGKYYFALEFASGDLPTQSNPAALFPTLGDIGLQLQRRQVPVEILVLDHLNSDPTGN